MIDRSEDSLTISVRTYRSGEFVHFVFAPLVVAFGALVLWIALTNGTLFESWVTLPLILTCLGYGWFALTKAFNRRTLTAGQEELRVSDGPVPSLARGADISMERLGSVRVRRQKRWIPPIWFRDVFHVDAGRVPRPLFKSLDSEEEATRIKAAVMAFRNRR
jgi:hypothetical protein